jgi:hypothetical protein
MKWLFVVALLAVGVASAEVVLEDSLGDVEATVTNWNDQIDLIGLDLEETEKDIIFRLEIADPGTSPDVFFFGSVNYWIGMDYGDNEWRLRINRGANIDTDVSWSGSLIQTNGEQGSFGRGIPVEIDVNTLVATVPRGALYNENFQELSRDRQLENIQVTSGGREISVADQRPINATDAMPDDGIGVDWIAKLGPLQIGPAILWSDTPYRASNGEETTYAFEVQLLSTETRDMNLRVENVPAGWNVILPVASVTSDNNAAIPVLAQVPFRHAHGLTETFSLIAENGVDYSELEMGVRYLDPAEVSGHHDTLYLHGGYLGGFISVNGVVDMPSTSGFMSTNPLDEFANGQTVHSNSGSVVCNFGDTQTCQRYYFRTQLFNGFDANVDEEGTLLVTVNFPAPVADAWAEATLHHRSFGDDGLSEVAALIGTRVEVGQSNGDVTFSIPMKAQEEADYIVPAWGQSLELEIQIGYTGVANTLNLADEAPLQVGIVGGEMKLPINDYHDDVSAYFDGIPSLVVHTPSIAELVNNDETRIFEIHLQNTGTKELDLHLQLDGNWATLLSEESQKVGGSETKTVFVAMRPTNAVNGDQEEVVLTIHSEALQEILTLIATVTDQDVVDDAEIASELEQKETPAPFAVILLALGALSMRRRTQ